MASERKLSSFEGDGLCVGTKGRARTFNVDVDGEFSVKSALRHAGDFRWNCPGSLSLDFASAILGSPLTADICSPSLFDGIPAVSSSCCILNDLFRYVRILYQIYTFIEFVFLKMKTITLARPSH